MRTPRILLLATVAGAALAVSSGCELLGQGDPFLRIHPFEFPHDSQGWTADFSGYSASESAKSLSLTFEHRLLPEEADQTGTALYLAGHNREQGNSLFMFVKRRVEDLAPNTAYRVHMTLKVTSTSPGKLCRTQTLPFDDPIRATIQAGAFSSEPTVKVRDGVHRFTVDRTRKAPVGRLARVDTIEHSLRNCGFPGGFHVLRTYNHNDQVRVRTDSDGRLWAVVGLETLFGVKTTFYIKSIKLFVRGKEAPIR